MSLRLRRLSVRRSTAAVGYKYYMTRHQGTRWNLVECDESEGIQGSVKELPRGDESVRRDHKSNEHSYDQREVLPHSGREKRKGNRGRGVLRKGRKRKALGAKREDILVLQILAET